MLDRMYFTSWRRDCVPVCFSKVYILHAFQGMGAFMSKRTENMVDS